MWPKLEFIRGSFLQLLLFRISVAELHHVDAAPASASTLIYLVKFLKQAKVNIRVRAIFSPEN
jgi:hypothetical protein